MTDIPPRILSEQVEFNVNANVWVRVTDVGFTLLTENEARYVRIQQEANAGWSKWQLWQLMATFGRNIRMGGSPPFETTIRFNTKAFDPVVDHG